MVDDKPRIHAVLEECCPIAFTTILVKQGKYSRDDSYRPRPDLTIERIGDLRSFTEADFMLPHPRPTTSAGTH
jgi:hypothetical protein